jgi:hypothetical protein
VCACVCVPFPSHNVYSLFSEQYFPIAWLQDLSVFDCEVGSKPVIIIIIIIIIIQGGSNMTGTDCV